MNFNNFLSPVEVNKFTAQNSKVTNFISCLDKHDKKEIWKPSKFTIGRFTTVGKILN